MKYENAKDILHAALLAEVQKYAEGILIMHLFSPKMTSIATSGTTSENIFKNNKKFF
jgi:hypothetical protein